MSRPLTEKQALAAYRVIVHGLEKQWGYKPDELLHDAVVQQGLAGWPTGKPALCRDYGSWSSTTDWAIVWEEGPFEWVHYLDGGVEEGFGFTLKPVAVPRTVFAEPIESFSLGLYRQEN